MRRPLSKSQSVCIVLLWAALCYIVLTTVRDKTIFLLFYPAFSL